MKISCTLLMMGAEPQKVITLSLISSNILIFTARTHTNNIFFLSKIAFTPKTGYGYQHTCIVLCLTFINMSYIYIYIYILILILKFQLIMDQRMKALLRKKYLDPLMLIYRSIFQFFNEVFFNWQNLLAMTLYHIFFSNVTALTLYLVSKILRNCTYFTILN